MYTPRLNYTRARTSVENRNRDCAGDVESNLQSNKESNSGPYLGNVARLTPQIARFTRQ